MKFNCIRIGFLQIQLKKTLDQPTIENKFPVEERNKIYNVWRKNCKVRLEMEPFRDRIPFLLVEISGDVKCDGQRVLALLSRDIAPNLCPSGNNGIIRMDVHSELFGENGRWVKILIYRRGATLHPPWLLILATRKQR
jgi:hypothetical protein